MNNLTTKQKVIMGVIIGVMTIIIGIFGYSMIAQEDDWEENALVIDENLENEVINQENSNIDDLADRVDLGNTETTIEQKDDTQLSEKTNKEGYSNLAGKIVIHITGAVQKTGILVLPEGARIADAIDASRRSNGKC